MSAAPAIRLDDVTLGYDRHPAVHHLSGEIAPGALLAVVGPNGAGKSTLLKGLVGTLAPLGGRIDRGALRLRDIAYLPQASALDRSFPIDVFDLVATGLWSRAGLFGGVGRAGRERAAEAIAGVGLAGFEGRPIATLSGGQLQRALFARLALQDAPVILLDEPFAAIDARTVSDLLELIGRWRAERRTVVAVLHDLELVRRSFPETLLLARRKVAWGPTSEALRPERLLEARGMQEAFDDHAPLCATHAA
ncbi:metal ABC transporter ATP-binding protein [Hansschlegelia zhihuaiae]|uniref:ABC transporter ATP-binding protein n=1 Tax=Hansschlegelia zhihuaiae TaxID=405005 RepID=A0A4V1KJ98_9HYPH|nr:ABC transporter ATP-binding protein [Hansschlegelia zhihuaiae]RXF73442.1 ABC transporter ATP-binding protein [Hansschlegelia zhihuaiae]